MAPMGLMDEVVLQTASEFMVARGDRRCAYLACISAFHLCDYVGRKEGVELRVVRTAIRSICQPAFDVVEGVSNGSKHCRQTGVPFRHGPGRERDLPSFGHGMDGYCQGHDGGLPSLEIELDCQQLLVDVCLLRLQSLPRALRIQRPGSPWPAPAPCRRPMDRRRPPRPCRCSPRSPRLGQAGRRRSGVVGVAIVAPDGGAALRCPPPSAARPDGRCRGWRSGSWRRSSPDVGPGSGHDVAE